MDVVRIIKILRVYGILKIIKKTSELDDKLDLIDVDVEIDDDGEFSDKHLFVFTFVGILIIEDKILKCYPKYLLKTKHPTEELKQIIKVLQKYNSREQIIHLYNDSDGTKKFNKLAVIIALLNDYYENGLYKDTQNVIETNGLGEVHWDETINETYPIIKNNIPYYVEMRTKRRVSNENNYFMNLHKYLLTKYSNELKETELDELLDIEPVDLYEQELDDFGDNEYILYRLYLEKNIQFNSRKLEVLKMMEALIENEAGISDIDSISMYGTNSFNLVWEKACAEVLNNQLHKPIGRLGIDNIVIPTNANYTVSDELISVIGKPKWKGYAEDNTEFEKEADKTLTPDLITVHQVGETRSFIIFDAKYYTVQLELQKELKGQPGVSDVTKQYLYQLAYTEFINANKFNKVRNCFLMPTEEDGNEGVIKKASVKMEMFATTNLEQIQVRQISAKKIFDCYLHNIKLDIDKLDL